MVGFQVFIQLICSLLRLPAPTTAPALELAMAPARGLELGTTPASASHSLETTTVVPFAKTTGKKRVKFSEMSHECVAVSSHTFPFLSSYG
jgi:hypothetical protein